MNQDQKNNNSIEEILGKGVYEDKLSSHIERTLVAHNRSLLQTCPETMWVSCGLGVIHEIVALIVHLSASTHESIGSADENCMTSTKIDSLSEPIHAKVLEAVADSLKFLPDIDLANRYFLKKLVEITGVKTISSGEASKEH